MISQKEKEYIEWELNEWLHSKRRNDQIKGLEYAAGKQDIMAFFLKHFHRDISSIL